MCLGLAENHDCRPAVITTEVSQSLLGILASDQQEPRVKAAASRALGAIADEAADRACSTLGVEVIPGIKQQQRTACLFANLWSLDSEKAIRLSCIHRDSEPLVCSLLQVVEQAVRADPAAAAAVQRHQALATLSHRLMLPPQQQHQQRQQLSLPGPVTASRSGPRKLCDRINSYW